MTPLRECVAGRQISRLDDPLWTNPCPRPGVHRFGVRYPHGTEMYWACDRHFQALTDAGWFT